MVTKRPSKSIPKRTGRRKQARELTIFEKIAERGRRIPPEELARHPPDFVKNFHHYMHGHAKQDPD